MHGQCAISSHFQFIISANQPEKIHVEVFVQIVAAGVILNDSVVVVYRDSQSASRQTTQLEFPVIVAVIYDPNFRGPWIHLKDQSRFHVFPDGTLIPKQNRYRPTYCKRLLPWLAVGIGAVAPNRRLKGMG